MIHYGKFVAALALVGLSQTAQADPGTGINIGPATIQPAAQVNFLVDSNVARAPTGLLDDAAAAAAESGEPMESVSSPGIEIKPSVAFTLNSDIMRLEFGYAQTARSYFLRPDYNFWNDASVRLNAEFLAGRPFGLSVRESFNFRNFPTPYTDETSGGTSSASGWESNLNSRTYNNFAIEGRYSPGSALDFNLGLYTNLDMQEYESLDAGTSPTKLEFGAVGKGKWRFFPRTLLLAQLDVATAAWEGTYTNIDGSGIEKAASNLFWTFQTGIAGQITNTIQANAFVGYGGLYSEGEATDDVSGAAGLTGQFQLLYLPTQGHSFSGSYLRRFTDSAIMDYIVTNSLSAGYNGLYLSNLNVGAQVRLDFAKYNSAQIDEGNSRDDFTMSALFTADYRLTPWLNLMGSFKPSYTGSSRNSESSADFDASYYTVGQVQFSLGVRGVY